MEPSKLEISAPKLSLTCDEKVIGHVISDEQLTLIHHGGRNRLFDIGLFCIGAGVGFAQNFFGLITALASASKSGPSLSLMTGNIVGSLVFAAFVATGISLLFSNKAKLETVDILVANIRNRKAIS